MDELTEADIPGSSLGDREPIHLTVKELKFWLSCRDLKFSKLKTKAALVAKVLNMKDEKLPLIDPTPGKLYLQRKKQLSGLHASSGNDHRARLCKPTNGWIKNLSTLPDFSDVNIRTYACLSGKNVNRKASCLQTDIAQQTCQKPEKRGYQFFFENYLHDIWVCYQDGLTFFKSKCFRSQRTKEKPHELWCAVSCQPPYDTLQAYCTCIAGASGFCNHIFGLLYQISHFSKSGAKEIETGPSRTSVPQQWDKPRVLGIAPEGVMQVVHQKANADSKTRKGIQCSLYEARREKVSSHDPLRILQMKDEVKVINPRIGLSYMAIADTGATNYARTSMGYFVPIGSFLSYQLAVTEGDFDVSYEGTTFEFVSCMDSCQLHNFPDIPINRRQDVASVTSLSMDKQDFVKDITLTQVECVSLEHETRKQTSSSKWWEARQKRLTSSNFGEICKRKSTSSKLVERLVDGKNDIRTASLKHGRDYEDIAAKKYEQYMCNIGHPLEVQHSGFVVSPQLPYLGCSPDRKVIDKKTHPHFGLAEIKCPYKHRNITPQNAALADKDFCCAICDGHVSLKKHHSYYYQVQGQMAITNLKWCDFVVYTFKGMHIERIQFDESFWTNVVAQLEHFYFSQYVPYCLLKDGQSTPISGTADADKVST